MNIANLILIILASFFSFWDAVTTYQGLNRLLPEAGYMTIVLTIAINLILFLTYMDTEDFNESLKAFAGFAWFIALVIDFATAWTGNYKLLHPTDTNFSLFNPATNHVHLGGSFLALLGGGALAVFTTGGTIFISHFVLGKKPAKK